MCQLLGLNCVTPTDASFSFTGFYESGGKTDHHADGWVHWFNQTSLLEPIGHIPPAEFEALYERGQQESSAVA